MIDRTCVSGDNNVTATGKESTAIGNVVFVLCPEHAQNRLTPTLAYELLKKFIAIDLPFDVDYSLELPAPLTEKLAYNDAPLYGEIFDHHQEDYLALEEAMRGLPASDRVVRIVSDLFSSTRGRYANSSEEHCGDCILADMQSVLVKKMVKEAAGDDSGAIHEEEIKCFCIALLQWCVMSCKVLVNPYARGNR